MAATPENPSHQALEALLLFYSDAGVDTMLEARPIDRFVESARVAAKPTQRNGMRTGKGETPTPSAPSQATSGQTPSPRTNPPSRMADAPETGPRLTVPDEAAFADARTLAAAANSIEELRAALEHFAGCNLRHSARKTVFADGNPQAQVMIIGEAPGRDEDMQGLPFVGRAGQLLDRMLAAIGLDRSNAYITNVIPWRPPGNRTPTAHEIELCRPFVERHIELAAPTQLLLLGNVSAKTLLNTERGILSIRGTFHEYRRGEFSRPAMPSLHPAYLLRAPAQKRHAWIDLQTFASRLEQASDEAGGD